MRTLTTTETLAAVTDASAAGLLSAAETVSAVGQAAVGVPFAAVASEVVAGPLSVGSAGWFLDNAWLVPLLPAVSFLGILAFGKRLRYKGAELGIAAVAGSLLLAVGAGAMWVDHRRRRRKLPVRESRPCTAAWRGCSPAAWTTTSVSWWTACR